MSKSKGRRTQRKAIEYFEEEGYLVDKVEKTNRFAKHKDLFGAECDGFDIIAIKPEEIILIQVKTNRPAKQKTYKKFAKKYSNDYIKVLVMTWYDYKGWRLQYYKQNGEIEEVDLRNG